MPTPELKAKLTPYSDNSGRPTKVRAFAELLIADSFVIKGIKVLEKADGSNAPFVVFPANKGQGDQSDRWFDIAHPVTIEARQAAIGLILETWRKLPKQK